MTQTIKKSPFRNKKRLFFVIAIVILTVVIGVGLFAFKNITQESIVTVEQKDTIEIPQASEKSNTPITEQQLPKGTFQDADLVHRGSGTVSVVQSDQYQDPVLVFGDDFSTTNGPDLFVYLSPNLPGEPLGSFVSLGNLKSTSGSQAYNLPTNYKDYKTVVIWCRAFEVTFSTAELK